MIRLFRGVMLSVGEIVDLMKFDWEVFLVFLIEIDRGRGGIVYGLYKRRWV